jgi:hypothetical protein
MAGLFASSLLAGAALVAPAQAAQQVELPPFEASRPFHTLPFELYDGRIYIKASGGGFLARTFLLDTGAQITHLTSELVREAGLETFGSVAIGGTGQMRVAGRYVRAASIDLGGVILPIEGAVSAPGASLFGPVVNSSGKSFDGVIGHDLFAAFVVEIDYEQRLIRLFDPAAFRDPPGADVIPIRILDRKPYLAATVGLEGGSIPAEFHLDTGSGGAIGFNGNFVAERDLLAVAGLTLPSISRGIGGSTPARLGRARSLTVGRTTLEGPFVTYALAQGAGVQGEAAGRLGGAILRRFTLTINYPGRTVSLVPNANFSRPLETDMSGLALGGSEGVVEILRVEEGSAAADAGIAAGDRLIGIDGQDASGLSLEAIRGMLMQHGQVRRLDVLRDGKPLSASVTLRRRI